MFTIPHLVKPCSTSSKGKFLNPCFKRVQVQLIPEAKMQISIAAVCDERKLCHMSSHVERLGDFYHKVLLLFEVLLCHTFRSVHKESNVSLSETQEL